MRDVPVAAMMLGVDEIYYALESPGDGGARIARAWIDHADTPFFRAPTITGGLLRSRAMEQYQRYCVSTPDSGFRR